MVYLIDEDTQRSTSLLGVVGVHRRSVKCGSVCHFGLMNPFQ